MRVNEAQQVAKLVCSGGRQSSAEDLRGDTQPQTHNDTNTGEVW